MHRVRPLAKLNRLDQSPGASPTLGEAITVAGSQKTGMDSHIGLVPRRREGNAP
jgi:hypothetical protein